MALRGGVVCVTIHAAMNQYNCVCRTVEGSARYKFGESVLRRATPSTTSTPTCTLNLIPGHHAGGVAFKRTLVDLLVHSRLTHSTKQESEQNDSSGHRQPSSESEERRPQRYKERYQKESQGASLWCSFRRPPTRCCSQVRLRLGRSPHRHGDGRYPPATQLGIPYARVRRLLSLTQLHSSGWRFQRGANDALRQWNCPRPEA